MQQQKRPRINPFIIVAALVLLMMVWSFFTASGTTGSTISYSKVMSYFENQQVTAFSLDLNTGVIRMSLKEGAVELPEQTDTTESSGGLLSGMLAGEEAGETPHNGGTVLLTYKLPYQGFFLQYQMLDYVEAYNEANPDAPMEYDMTPLKDSVPWGEILIYVALLGCTGFVFFSMLRGGGAGGGIMNVGKAKVRDESENQRKATFADVAGEEEEKEELQEVV